MQGMTLPKLEIVLAWVEDRGGGGRWVVGIKDAPPPPPGTEGLRFDLCVSFSTLLTYPSRSVGVVQVQVGL